MVAMVIAWKRLDARGLERCELAPDTRGWSLRGTILLSDAGQRFEARYELVCDSAWRTRAIAIDVRRPDGERSRRFTVEDGRWSLDGTEIDAVRGCIDVDLAWTPSTNTLPIRRLELAVGQSQAVTAAWVRFPDLTVEPLPQEYLRLAERRYRYSSAGGRFVAELEVDEHGLVTTYGDIWARA